MPSSCSCHCRNVSPLFRYRRWPFRTLEKATHNRGPVTSHPSTLQTTIVHGCWTLCCIDRKSKRFPVRRRCSVLILLLCSTWRAPPNTLTTSAIGWYKMCGTVAMRRGAWNWTSAALAFAKVKMAQMTQPIACALSLEVITLWIRSY